MALLLLTISATGIQLWQLLHRWRQLAQLQLALDRCTGDAIVGLQTNLVRTTRSAQRYDALKAAALAPAAGAAALTALKAEWLIQQALEMEWKARSVAWASTALRCGGQLSLGSPHPGFPWRRDPPDALGPGNLRWSGPATYQFTLILRGRNRSSAAQTSKGGTSPGLISKPWIEANRWRARWIDSHQASAALHSP